MTYEDKLQELTAQNPDIVVLTAENRGPMRNLASALGERFIDFGIAEQTMVGAAAGLALRGRIPVVHAFSSFLTMRAYEFVRTDVGVGRLPVKLFGAMSGFLSEANGPTHQALEDIALMRGIPGMQIVCPADTEELIAALPAIIGSPNPCYTRYCSAEAAVRHREDFSFGKAELIREGRSVAILTYGHLLGEALQAADLIEARSFSVRLLNLRTLQPIDESAIVEAASQTGFLVTVEDHFVTGGLFSIVSEVLTRNRVICRVLPIGLEARWFRPALLADVLKYENFDAPHLAARILESLEKRPSSIATH